MKATGACDEEGKCVTCSDVSADEQPRSSFPNPLAFFSAYKELFQNSYNVIKIFIEFFRNIFHRNRIDLLLRG